MLNQIVFVMLKHNLRTTDRFHFIKEEVRMNVGTSRTALFALFACLALSTAALAQYPDMDVMRYSSGNGPFERGTISASGAVALKQPPMAIRMNVELLGKGKMLQEAINDLKDRREAVVNQLLKLKAVKESISSSSPTLTNAKSQQQRELEMMMAQRAAAAGKKAAKGANVPETFAVSAVLTAEWLLEEKTPEYALIACQTLNQKIKAANVFPVKEEEKLSPEEEEVAKEMAEMMAARGQGESTRGQPSFVYVARITPAEREKAMAKAFAKAKTQAESLAKAAGVTLGPLNGMTGDGGGTHSFPDGNEEPFGYSHYDDVSRYMGRIQTMRNVEKMDEMQNESSGGDPDALMFTITVAATFNLGK
jgi:uncharacterized protein YggE